MILEACEGKLREERGRERQPSAAVALNGGEPLHCRCLAQEQLLVLQENKQSTTL